MMLRDFVAALGLVLVFEGMMPFLSPSRWRRMALSMISQHDPVLRTMGFVCMLIGVAVLVIVHHFANGV